jgi:ABC-type lipoprotein release transport system permease subunit
MGWRNLWRNPRRTAITLSAIAFAVALAVLLTGFQDSSWNDVINLAARMGAGHVTIQHPDYLDKPALSRTVAETAPVIAVAREDGDVVRAVPRIAGQVLLSTAHESGGAGFIAFDPAAEDRTTLSLLDAVSQGRSFGASRERGIILGERLARNLRAKRGNKVVYTMTGRSGRMVTGLARVTGIVRTGSPSVDLGLCLFPLDSLRETLGYGADEATQVAVFLADQRASERVARRLGARIGKGYAVLPWRQTNPDLSYFIAMKKGGMVFFELLILVLCAAGIFNTMFVSVMERLREFGILTAVGFSPARLFSLVVWESFWLALLGLGCGAVLAAWPYWYMSRTGIDLSFMLGQKTMDVAGVGVTMVLRVGIYAEHAAWIVAAVVAATMLSGLYPAWRAARVEPVESIKLV